MYHVEERAAPVPWATWLRLCMYLCIYTHGKVPPSLAIYINCFRLYLHVRRSSDLGDWFACKWTTMGIASRALHLFTATHVFINNIRALNQLVIFDLSTKYFYCLKYIFFYGSGGCHDIAWFTMNYLYLVWPENFFARHRKKLSTKMKMEWIKCCVKILIRIKILLIFTFD